MWLAKWPACAEHPGNGTCGHQYRLPTFLPRPCPPSASGALLNQLKPDLQTPDPFFSLPFFSTSPCTLRPFLPHSLMAPRRHTRLPGPTSAASGNSHSCSDLESFTHCGLALGTCCPTTLRCHPGPDGLPMRHSALVLAGGGVGAVLFTAASELRSVRSALGSKGCPEWTGAGTRRSDFSEAPFPCQSQLLSHSSSDTRLRSYRDIQ